MLPAIITFMQAGLGSIAAPLAACVVVLGAAMGISRIGKSAMDAIARQPEAAGDIRMSMIIAAALIEGVSFFAIVVCLMVI